MESLHYCFIINPIAGKRRADVWEKRIQSEMEASKQSFSIHRTNAPGDAIRITKAQSKKKIRVWVVSFGGDGTLNEVINGAAFAKNVIVAVIPTGSGNDFVRCFSHPEQFFSFAALQSGTIHTLDLLRVNGRYAINLVNIGFDCDVVEQASRFHSLRLLCGPIGYLVSVFIVLSRKMGKRMTVVTDHETFQMDDYLLSTMANGRYYGGGFCAAPKSCADDGKMDVALIKKVSRLRFLSLLSSYKKGTYQEKEVLAPLLISRRVKNLRIRFSSLTGICIDGEITHATAVSIETAPRAVRFLVPNGVVPKDGFLSGEAV